MTHHDDFRRFKELFNDTTQWYLNEIIYCLQHYLGKSKSQAKKALLDSYLVNILQDEPAMVEREPGYYWAMCIEYGFNTPWWKRDDLQKEYDEYVNERHHPPIDI